MTTTTAFTSENELELSLHSTAFFGRGFDEYAEFFGLDASALGGRSVLDAAAGPSAFTAEAHARGVRAIAADPLYGHRLETLATYVQIDYARMIAEMRRKASLMRYGRFASVEEAEASRRAAAARFLADYETGFAEGRYVGAALPKLPFADASFDHVLCAHLLFIYARHFDFAWHLAACAELARVAKVEVRIHPLCGPDGKEYPELPRLRAALGEAGITTEIIPVPPGVFAGTDTTLVLQK